MGFLLLGALALLLLLGLAYGYSRADVATLARLFRIMGGCLLGLVALVMLLTGRFGIGLAIGSAAYLLLTKGRLIPKGANIPGMRPRSSNMSRAEALDILGLQETATKAEIRAAHHRLIQQNHPDLGGTNYLAAKINEAKDVLLG